MLAHPAARRTAAIATALLLAAATWAVSAIAASSAGASTTASAAAKRCTGGKVLVKRPGRSSVCAPRCPAGTKRKVSSRGKLSCVRKPGTGSGPAPAPPTPSGTEPAAPSGPAAGTYSGTTEQERPVGFTIEGGQVKNFEAGVNTWCNTMYNNRVNFDAIANVPPMPIGPDGSFSYEGDENNGNMKITGVVTGNTATGTVGMFRGDTNYSGGQMYFGNCSASDVKWNATTG